ncbi:ABC transporter transmembrane domain-containing protein [Algirhabdus cladophorae]|uniref:ABC transporter transmembrane domain-containing protein n=1 Tax=Algirhabdus cladophorae TaxID=3377108 RepID=UPI003B8476E4
MYKKAWKGRVAGIRTDVPILAASFTLNVLAMLTPLAILLIFDRVIPFQAFETLTVLTLLLCVSAALEFVLRWSRSCVLSVAAERAAVENHMQFLNRVTEANVKDFAQVPAALHTERHGAIAKLRDHFSGQNQALAIDLPFTAVFFAMIALIGGWLVLVPLTSLSAILIFAAIMKSAQGSIFDQRKTLDERRYAFLADVLSKIATVKSNTMERQMTRRFERLQDQTVETSYKLIIFSGFAQSFGSIISQLSIAGIGLFGAFLVIQSYFGIAELAACMMLNGRIIQPLTRLVSLRVQSEMLSVSRQMLGKMDALDKPYIPATPVQSLRGDIILRKVILDEAGRSQPVTKEINSGSTVLVDSRHDWAMPALIDVITGQASPHGGSVLIDGLMANDRIAERGASALVVLERVPAIFTGTILDNISAFGDAEQVECAKHYAQKLGLERRIFRQPAGYLTELNTNNIFEKDRVNRQLISLVRVLALKPKILLMNEPTGCLETPEREALSKCLADLPWQPTILMASPDPRMKRLADDVLSIATSKDASIATWDADAQADKAASRKPARGAA